MKYKRIIFISLLLSLIGLMCLFVFAEKEVLPKTAEFQLPKIPVMPKFAEQVILTWDKTYGGNGSDQAYSLIQTTDGGYAVAGAISSKGAGKLDFRVTKLDNQGYMMWERTFGGSGDDGAFSLIQTTDGGYAVVGATSSKGAGGADLWLIKLDSQGNMIWDKTYGSSDDDWAYSLIQTTDGGYAVAGATFSKGRGDDLWVIKLDSQGNEVWDIIFGSNGDDWGYSIIQTTDGGYAVVMAHSSEDADGSIFIIMKVDAQGNLR